MAVPPAVEANSRRNPHSSYRRKSSPDLDTLEKGFYTGVKFAAGGSNMTQNWLPYEGLLYSLGDSGCGSLSDDSNFTPLRSQVYPERNKFSSPSVQFLSIQPSGEHRPMAQEQTLSKFTRYQILIDSLSLVHPVYRHTGLHGDRPPPGGHTHHGVCLRRGAFERHTCNEII